MTTTTGPRWGPPVEEVPEGACDNGIDGCYEHTPLRTGVQIICGACGAVNPTNGRRAARTPVRFWSRRIPRDDETSWQLELQRPYAWKIYWEMQRCCTGAYMHCTGEQDGGDENEAELNQRYEGGAVGGIRPKGREQSSVPSPEGYAERRKKDIDDESDGITGVFADGRDQITVIDVRKRPQNFQRQEIETALAAMAADGDIILADGIIRLFNEQ